MPDHRAELRIDGARENNLRDLTVTLPPGMTALVGVSGSGKSSLAFDTLYHEARRRYLDTLSLGSPALRMPPARVRAIHGLGPAVAVAQNVLNRNPNSTVATAAGIHPYLRVLFARFAERRCPDCGAVVTRASLEEQVAVLRRLAADAGGAVDVIAPLVRTAEGSHGRLLTWLAARWKARDLEVDGGRWSGAALDAGLPHDIAVRAARITAADGAATMRSALERVAALGSAQVVLRTGPLERFLSRADLCPACGRAFTILEPEDFHRAAASIDTYRLDGRCFDELLALDVAAAAAALRGLRLPDVAAAIVAQLRRRLDGLLAVGLGYLPLDRPSPTLSRGEAQRLRIALLLANPIEDMLHVLDEPTIGLDPGQVLGILDQVARLRGPVVMVEHERWAVATADHVIELGPGAGDEGGRVVFEGTAAELWRSDTVSGRWFSGRDRPVAPEPRPEPRTWIRIEGASAHNLRDLDVALPVGRLTVVAGPSGAGKSTLVRDVLAASVARGEPVECRAVGGGEAMRVVTVSQEPIGRNGRSNAATYSGLADVIRAMFAAATGEPPGRFSFNKPEGACPACEGIGSVELKLPYVPSEWLPCEACRGRRFAPDVLGRAIRLPDGAARSVADVYDLEVDEAAALFADGPAATILASLQAVGLGYLRIGQPSPTLSGGEAQRVKLAKWLSTARPSDLVVLDEPTTGLHPADVSRLIDVLRGLVDRGCTVVVVEHQPAIIAAADWVVRIGPGGGPEGGQLLHAGPPAKDAQGEPRARPRATPRRRQRATPEIRVRAASANNLRKVSVDLPKGRITGVVGVSGSGKSSLVRDVLEAEAVRRFVESLSMYERQSVKEGPEAPARRIEGLGPTISIGASRRREAVLSTVGTATEVSFHLGVLLAFAGVRTCPACGDDQRRGPSLVGAGGSDPPWRCDACRSAGPAAGPHHFSPSTYAAACLACHGVGTEAIPRLERLIVRPDLPICAGAMYSPGYFPTGYLSRPPSYGYYMLQGLAATYGFDPFETPWQEMTDAARDAFLTGEEEVELPPRPEGGPPTMRWRGVFRIVAGWDLGGLYTDHVTCPMCNGGRLRPEFLGVRLGTANRHELHARPIHEVDAALADVAVPADAPSWVERSRLVARRRLAFLERVGLRHLNLDRLSRTLSAGEAQRVRLASLLGAELTGLTVLLDEPSRGLHPREVDALADALGELRSGGNTVVLVDHDPRLIERVDHLVVLGPGAGRDGGRVLAAGTAAEVRRSATGRVAEIIGSLPGPPGSAVRRPRSRRSPSGEMVVRAPSANNLRGDDIAIPLGVLAGLCGVSGSGKSTLAIDIVALALAPPKLTTSVAYEDIRPGPHRGIDGAPERVVVSDQSRSGIHTPGGFLGVIDPIRRAFGESAAAAARGLDANALAADCDHCHGRGHIREDMGFLPSIERPCDACAGTGYRLEVRELRVRGTSLADVAGQTLIGVLERWEDLERVRRPLDVAVSLGLGYLTVGQPSHSLSGGEAQRLRLARELARPARRPTLFILDEPTVGLHALDVDRLVDVLDGLVERGHSVLVIEHDPLLLARCDRLLELGPGGGPDGGRVVAAGAPEVVAAGATATASYLRMALA